MATIHFNFPIPATLPSVPGLFKKNETIAKNGWANVDKKYLNSKLISKLESANYKLLASKTKWGDSGDNYSALYVSESTGDVVAVSAINYAECYNSKGQETGRSAYGNVNFYRGDRMQGVLDTLEYAIDEDGYCRKKADIEAQKAEEEQKKEATKEAAKEVWGIDLTSEPKKAKKVKKAEKKATEEPIDKKNVEEKKDAETAENEVKTEFDDELSILDSTLRAKLTPAEIQTIKNELLRLRNNFGTNLLGWLETEEDLTKKKMGKYYLGDIHPEHSNWMWTEYKPGKADWRAIKK